MAVNNWINAKDQLPPLNWPVLCVVEASCKCKHYIQVVLARDEYEEDSDEWAWITGIDADKSLYVTEMVLYWQYLPKMVEGLHPGYPEVN